MNSGTVISWALFGCVIAVGFVGYFLGKSVGREEGRVIGHRLGFKAGREQWIKAMENRRADSVSRGGVEDALLSVNVPRAGYARQHERGPVNPRIWE